MIQISMTGIPVRNGVALHEMFSDWSTERRSDCGEVVLQVFKVAKVMAPSLIYIDEVEKVTFLWLATKCMMCLLLERLHPCQVAQSAFVVQPQRYHIQAYVCCWHPISCLSCILKTACVRFDNQVAMQIL